jgi:hypothetical protein
MSQPVSPEEKAHLQKLILFAIDLKKRDLRDSTILRELEGVGATPENARNVLNAVNSMRKQQSQDYGSASREAALRAMGIGAIICMIGIIVTVGSYKSVSQAGGSYVVAYGAIIWGGFQFLRGLYLYSNG